MTTAEQYARWVLAPENEVKNGRLVKLACQRFLNDLERTDLVFDEEEASHCINFIERYCIQWEGSWRGMAFTLEPWQKFALQNIYGWLKKNGKRRFTKAYIQIAKKNGKSSLSAGVSLFHLLADKRINTPKVFTAANNEDQAKICVNIAGRIAENSEEIQDVADVRLMRYKENITEVLYDDPLRGSGFIKALAKEGGDKTSKTSGGKHGINASLGIVDEFGMSPDHGASKPIETSMVSRPERLMLFITTAGFNMDGPCYRELRASGIKVLEGLTEMDNYFALMFEIDKPMVDDKPGDITIEWLLANEDVWQQSNPNIDVSVERDALRDALKEALNYGGTTEVDVKTLNFNIWVDSVDTFISAEKWAKNSHGADITTLQGEVAYAGIELVSGNTLNSFVLFFPETNSILPLFWMPHGCIRDHDQFERWVKEGYIKTFLDDVCDNDEVLEWLESELTKYQVMSFAYETSLSSNSIVQGLSKKGFTANVITHGVKGISTPTIAWEELITSGKAEHFGNPVMAWMNSNCLAKRKDNQVRIEKLKSKQVGIYAAINALAEYKTFGQNQTLGIVFL
jgi:phage terminase large subunit-like protein